MAQNDLIADALTRIRNAVQAGHDGVTIPCSRILSEVMRVLKEEGYIKNFRMVQDKPARTVIRVQLKSGEDEKSVIRHLSRMSTSSLRSYKGYRDLPHVLRGLGTSILSTSKGIMTDRQARKLKVGGEVLCQVY